MKLNFTYRISGELDEKLKNLAVIRKLLEVLPHVPAFEEKIRRQSLLKSSLYSARIEGNRLNLSDIDTYAGIGGKTKEKLEVFNILSALSMVYGSWQKTLTVHFIRDLHKIVMKGLASDLGYFRTEPSAIFNQAGVAVYLPPPPNEVLPLLKDLIKAVNKSRDEGPVVAAYCHFVFEKTHPFLDGNGRVGRLISTFILKNSGYHLRGMITLEQYLEENRESYYALLSRHGPDISEFIEFFIKGLSLQAEQLLDKLKQADKPNQEDLLLPRRQEILLMIKDHKMVSFDFLRRRFLAVAQSTLHYDLKQLLKGNFIKKLGSTRGSLYVPMNSRS